MSQIVREIYFERGPVGFEERSAGRIQGTPTPFVTFEDIADKAAELNETFQIATDPETGLKIEIGVTNVHMLGKHTVLHYATSNSSLTSNVGNAAEECAHAAANTNAARLYIAPAGVGGSDKMPASDRKKLISTGRGTTGTVADGDAQPLEYYQAVARILDKTKIDGNNLSPTHVSTNVEGGRPALAMMSALETNTVVEAYFNGMPGISKGRGYATSMVKEDNQGRKRDESPNASPFRASAIADIVKESMPDVYDTPEHKKLKRQTLRRMPGSILTYARAYSGHNDLQEPTDHAVMQDTLAALSRQEAVLTFQTNEDNKQYDFAGLIEFGRRTMNALGDQASETRRIKLLLGSGSLDRHTEMPEERWKMERYALSSIAYFMRAPLIGHQFVVPDASQRSA